MEPAKTKAKRVTKAKAKPVEAQVEAPKPLILNSLRQIPTSIAPARTMSSEELVVILDNAITTARQAPDGKKVRVIRELEAVSRQPQFKMGEPMPPYPSNGDPTDASNWLEQLVARALHQTLEAKTKEECFGVKNIILAMVKAGIKLPASAGIDIVGRDAARRMATIKGTRLAF